MRFSSSLLLATTALLATTTAYATGEWGVEGSAITNQKEDTVFINITVIDKGSTGFCDLNSIPIGKFPIIDYKVRCHNPAYSLSLTWQNFDSQLLVTLGTPESGLYQYDAQIYNRQKLVPYDRGCKFGFTNGLDGEVVFSGNQQTQSLDRRDTDATSVSTIGNSLSVSISIKQSNNENIIIVRVNDGGNKICNVLSQGYENFASGSPCVKYRQDGSFYQVDIQVDLKFDSQGKFIQIEIFNFSYGAGRRYTVSADPVVSSNGQWQNRGYTVEYDNTSEITRRTFRA